MEKDTIKQYQDIIASCKDVFEKKTRDYGTAWRILRISSITDQIFIKAQRIRSIQEKGTQLVEDKVEGEFMGIINYCIIAMIQLELPENASLELPYETLDPMYTRLADETLELLTKKNHDYGEAWRDMRISSITDIVLMKLLRVKQIEDNQGQTIISEGVKANYQDMINYAVFSLIKIREGEQV